MERARFKSVDDYIASQPATVQTLLETVRRTIHKAAPDAEEMISYNIPTYKLHGIHVLHFAGWKQHYSLYPANDRLVAAFQEGLASYTVDKGTIRFPLSEPVPVKLIESIAKFRAKEVADRVTAQRGEEHPLPKRPDTGSRRRI